MSRIPYRWTRIIAWIACLSAFAAFAYHASLWSPRLTSGFAMYYTYARLTLNGESLDRVYDDTNFNARVREFGFDLQDKPNNPPTAGLAYLGVAWLAPVPAKIAWTCLSVAALVWALSLLFALSGIRPSGGAGLWLLALVFIFRPLSESIAFGQIYCLLLLLFALSMKAAVLERTGGAALPLAFSTVLKGYGIIPAILFGVWRRWKVIGVMLAVSAFVIAGTLPLLGRGSWTAFVGTVIPALGGLPPNAHVAYQTINGLLRHLFTYDPEWLPHPAVVLPGLAVSLLSYGIRLALVAWVLTRPAIRSGRKKFLALGAALGAGVVTAPLAEEYHYVLFIPLVFALAAVHVHRPLEWKNPGTLIAAGAILLMAAPVDYKHLQYAFFPLVLLAYPKLYAGLTILWYAGLLAGRREPDNARGAG